MKDISKENEQKLKGEQMYHFYDVEIAAKYGIPCAVILENLSFWIAKNEANGNHFHDGCFWTYNSTRAFTELFPEFSARQLSAAIEKLKTEGVIKTANYNKLKFDRTTWYAFTEKGKCIIQKCKMDFTKSANAFTENVKPIPDINTYINTDINTDRDAEQASCSASFILKNDVLDLFDVFWKNYPRKTDKEKAKKAFAKLKPDENLLSTMVFAIEKQKKSKQWKDATYIPHPTTWLNGRRWEDETDAEQEISETERIMSL